MLVSPPSRPPTPCRASASCARRKSRPTLPWENSWKNWGGLTGQRIVVVSGDRGADTPGAFACFAPCSGPTSDIRTFPQVSGAATGLWSVNGQYQPLGLLTQAHPSAVAHAAGAGGVSVRRDGLCHVEPDVVEAAPAVLASDTGAVIHRMTRVQSGAAVAASPSFRRSDRYFGSSSISGFLSHGKPWAVSCSGRSRTSLLTQARSVDPPLAQRERATHGCPATSRQLTDRDARSPCVQLSWPASSCSQQLSCQSALATSRPEAHTEIFGRWLRIRPRWTLALRRTFLCLLLGLAAGHPAQTVEVPAARPTPSVHRSGRGTPTRLSR